MITVKALNGIFTCYENDWIIREIQDCGAFCRPELGMILQFLRQGDTALDIGAHIGTFSVPIKNAIGPSGRLLAFEANPETFSLLQKNLKDNGIKAEAFNYGVSDKKTPLYLKGRRLKDRSISIDDNTPLNSGADYLTDTPQSGTDSLVTVASVQIDDIISEKIHFMKIDVEGMELSVLRSAEETIDRDHPIIYSEYLPYYLERAGEDPNQYENFLKNKGYHFFINARLRKASNDEYTLVRIPGPKYIRGQVDFLLIHKDSDRYPKHFLDWKTYKPYRFIWNKLRNFLSPFKRLVKNVGIFSFRIPFIVLPKKIIYSFLKILAVTPRLGPAFKNLCQYYIRYQNNYTYDMHKNGEYEIIRVLSQHKFTALPTLFDVGANKGEWSKIALTLLPNARIYCFEPCPETYDILCNSLRPYQNATIENIGLSNRHDQLKFNNYGHASGRNSFVQKPSFPHGPVQTVETIDVWSAKEYIQKSNIQHIDFMKIDVEGWEYFVLLGLEEFLDPNFVSVIQFEYGYAHGDTRYLMKDFYSLLKAKGYKVGKLSQSGVHFTDFIYHMNNFESGPNFIACHQNYQDSLSHFQ